MNLSELFFSTKLAFPWSVPVIGPLLLASVALLLVLFTLWSYRGHTQATPRRVLIVLVLRLLALVVLLLTAVRPSVGVQETPKIPTRLLIGIDLSESMSIRDEFGSQSRHDAVKKMLEKAQPTLDALQDEQNCEVQFYMFGSNTFTEATGAYDPVASPVLQQSNYGVYLSQMHQRWQGERFLRAHLIIGDGADNGLSVSAVDQAAKWRGLAPLQTFGVGDIRTMSDRKDVALYDLVFDPDPVAVKNTVTMRLRVNALGVAGLTAPLKVQFDTDGTGYKDVLIDKVKLAKETDNRLEIPLRAPDELPMGEDKKPRRQIKVRVEIPADQVPGDTAPLNNVLESYLNLNKEGLRMLLVDRYRYEYSRLLDALTADPRFDVRKVDLQTDEGGTGLREALNFDEQGYDVLVLGNITPKQLEAIDPDLPATIAERVKTRGLGLMMIGGHATLAGTPGFDAATAQGWRGVSPLEEILPVTLSDAPREAERANARYQVVPEPRESDQYITKLADTRADSLQLWEKLNSPENKARFTGLNRLGRVKASATVYLWACDSDNLVNLQQPTETQKQYPLLVGQQFDTQNKSRVLVFAAQDTMMWERLGQPQSNDGSVLHSRFWRQLILWLAKQDTEDGAAFIRPEYPRLAVGAKQGYKLGLRGPNGLPVKNPTYDVQVLGPGEAADPTKAVPVETGTDGLPRAESVPWQAGEYTVVLKASGTITENGEDKTITDTATGKFLAYPEVSDELLRAAADFEFLKTLSSVGGGQFRRLDDLPAYLAELRNQPMETIKPRPRYYPDWRREKSQGFLPGWLILFAALLLTEWGLRRTWGMV